ncbi:E3 ubiquitin-protein ligase ATL31-like [Lycium barbarum]|uniref:E3 ubiquitin-protein ligase ATL31-like n=1 Tax=Lycium barbarum TaxID=112863 RepID=UPI00293F4406|nr:E3 ubiquitin-protein ligase ATL31-like [Lycium barbarum]
MGSFKKQESSIFCYVLFVFLFSFPLIPKSVVAQPPPTTGNGYQYAKLSPPLAIIIIVLIAALFFMAAFSVYIRHCTQSSTMTGSVRRALSLRRRAAAARGLHASVIETFPILTYAEVKDHQIGKGALECAVCLNEFEDDETLRLIPKCDHVFHPDCIDAWLGSHDTCPVCRADLNPQPGEPPVQVPELNRVEPEIDQQEQNDEVSIHIVNDEEQRQQQEEDGSVRSRGNRVSKQDEPGSAKPGVKRNLSFNIPVRAPRSVSMKPRIFSKFRSHSTGHSLVLPGENLDRYTLRLPDGVRKEVMNRALLNRAKSFGGATGSSRKGYRTGNKRIELSEPEVKSDRWVFTMAPPFFSRGSSMKLPSSEGSTSGSVRTAVKLPSFKCLEPKGDETYLMTSADSARPPV